MEDNAEKDEQPPPNPPKLKGKHIAWKVGVILLTPLYCLILAIYGYSMSGWWVIFLLAIVFGAFLISLILHLRDMGGSAQMGTYVRNHLFGSLSAIVVLFCVIVGTGIYLAIRIKTELNKAALARPAASTPQTAVSTPPAPTIPPNLKVQNPNGLAGTQRRALAPRQAPPAGGDTITADHGIAIGGHARVDHPMVDNRQYGVPNPPPNVVDLEFKDLPPISKDLQTLEGSAGTRPGVLAIFKVDGQFSIPIFTISCDRPCVASLALTQPLQPMGPRYLTTDDPNLVRAILGTVSPLMSDTQVAIRIRSRDDNRISITKIEGYIQPVR